MKLYHYSTWAGEAILKAGVVRPSTRYRGNTTWPKMVFLTETPEWEPSVQAKSKEGFWEKCGSTPEVYKQLGIPCWRFEVKADSTNLTHAHHIHYPGWSAMLMDATDLCGHIGKWWVAFYEVPIISGEKLSP